MNWLFYALLSAFFAALVAIFGKIGLKGIDSNTATAIRAVIMALFLSGVIVFQGKLVEAGNIVMNSKALIFIVLSGIAGALSWLFYFLALQNGKVCQVVPVDRLSAVFALILAVLILGEHISFKAVLGAAFIVTGGILIALG